jgi:hypothetical protein
MRRKEIPGFANALVARRPRLKANSEDTSQKDENLKRGERYAEKINSCQGDSNQMP